MRVYELKLTIYLVADSQEQAEKTVEDALGAYSSEFWSDHEPVVEQWYLDQISITSYTPDRESLIGKMIIDQDQATKAANVICRQEPG